MDTALVQIFVGCLLIFWKLGLVQNLTNCQKKYEYYGFDILFVNVCQDNSRWLESGTPGVVVIDSAGAPLRQDIECRCYLTFYQQQQNMHVYLNIDGGGTQDVEFEINGQVYNNGRTLIAITSGTQLIYRQGYQGHHAKVCMGISKAMLRGSLNIQCKAKRKERKRSTTTERPTATTKRPTTRTTTTERPTATIKRPTTRTTTTERPTATTKRPTTRTTTTTDRPITATKRPTMTTQGTHSVSSSGPTSKKTALPAMPKKTPTRTASNKTPTQDLVTSSITTQNEKARSIGPLLGIVIGTVTCAVVVIAVIAVGIKALVWRRKRKANETKIQSDGVVPTYHNVAYLQTANASSHSLVSSGYVNVRLPRDPSSSTVSNTYESLQNHYNREDDHYYSTALY